MGRNFFKDASRKFECLLISIEFMWLRSAQETGDGEIGGFLVFQGKDLGYPLYVNSICSTLWYWFLSYQDFCCITLPIWISLMVAEISTQMLNKFYEMQVSKWWYETLIK